MIPYETQSEGYEARLAYLWTYILNTPFWAIYNMLPFILWKDLDASLWQITLMVTLKPAVSLLSVYWSELVKGRQDRLISNVSLGCLIGHLPFLFFPWMNNVWWFIASFALYKLLYRGVIPAWMEILKRSSEASKRYRLVAYAITMSYVGSAIFPVFFGWMMDDYFQAWRWIFFFTSLISLGAIYLQRKIPAWEPVAESSMEWKKALTAPWRSVYNLLCQRVDYTHFQIGFMFGGFGIMVLQPALPEFFMSVLNLNYKELGMAMTMCKGIGFALTSSLWAAWMKKTDIFRFSALVVLLFALFPLGLLLAKVNVLWIYFAYLGYGVMQAGSQLSWKLSGPLFSNHEDSSIYSGVNILTVGLRGLVANPFGGLVALYAGPAAVLLLGSGLCFFAAFYLWRFKPATLPAPAQI